MGRLAIALKQKYPNAKAALKALGLDESLLDAGKLALDHKRKLVVDEGGERLGEEPEPHQAAFRHLQHLLTQVLPAGEDREIAMHHLESLLGNTVGGDGMADLGDEEAEQSLDEEDPDRDEQQRAKRREVMKMIAEKGRDEWGWDEEQVRREIARFPRNGLHHMNAAVFGEDAEAVLKELGMGSKDRKRMAKDAAHRRFDEWYPDAARLRGSPSDMANYGDREPLAMDEMSAEEADRFEAWYGASRIGIA
jgi:hypothetical protein